MQLKDAKGNIDYYSEKASAAVRQLAFAGIVAVWIFRGDADASLRLPFFLILAMLAFCFSLGFDLLHYVVGAKTWRQINRHWEEKIGKLNPEAEIKFYPEQRRWIDRLYWAKIIAVLTGYVALAVHLVGAGFFDCLQHPPAAGAQMSLTGLIGFV